MEPSSVIAFEHSTAALPLCAIEPRIDKIANYVIEVSRVDVECRVRGAVTLCEFASAFFREFGVNQLSKFPCYGVCKMSELRQ